MTPEDFQKLCIRDVQTAGYDPGDLEEIRKLADEGDSEALFHQAVILASQGKFDCAAVLAEEATDLKHPTATYLASRLYRYGIGVEKNLVKSGKLLAKADILGNIEAKVDLGILFIEYEGFKEGIKLLKEAAKSGEMAGLDAKLYLAEFYKGKYGIPANFKKSEEYFASAVEGGHPVALFTMGKRLGRLADRQTDAAVYLARAAARGHEEARSLLKQIDVSSASKLAMLANVTPPASLLLN